MYDFVYIHWLMYMQLSVLHPIRERFNLQAKEGDFGYDQGEVLFDEISRLNHSCDPNLEFELAWDEGEMTVVRLCRSHVDLLRSLRGYLHEDT